MNDKKFSSKLARKIIFRCAITVFIVSVLYVIAVVVAYNIGYRINWKQSVLYFFLKTLKSYESIIVPGAWFLIVLIIIYIYWKKTVGFIEDIAAASMTLVKPDDEDIRLPEELRDIEDRMNQIKRTALRNEREAREAEQRKNDLVVNLAHDIRTPLSSVIGYLSLLNEAHDMPLEQRKKYTEITLEKAFRLEHLINELFEITRFNLSSIVLNRGKINLTFMLQQMADEFYPMLAPQNKKAIVHAPENLIAWGDADKLSRVFNNILKNAIAYSYEGSEIDITAYERDKSTVIEFSNYGDPIPPEKLEAIFERFFRLDTSRSSRTGGAGLGLAIAKEIVNAHGGKITARSNGGRTTFTVVLPVQSSMNADSIKK
ncbi:MAG TPA: HAMP domain-containing sensor histidine kinase [Thermoclostridium sp.]